MEAAIQRYIIKKHVENVRIFMEQVIKHTTCEHKWEKYKFMNEQVYKCQKCTFLSQDKKLNKLIKKLLTTKDK